MMIIHAWDVGLDFRSKTPKTIAIQYPADQLLQIHKCYSCFSVGFNNMFPTVRDLRNQFPYYFLSSFSVFLISKSTSTRLLVHTLVHIYIV